MTSKPQKGKTYIHLMIGRCISEWAAIEETLFDIFCIVLGTEAVLASVVFYKTPTLDGRITLTNDLIDAIFPTRAGGKPHPLVKEWKAIRQCHVDIVPYRNLMAHHPVDEVGSGSFQISDLRSVYDLYGLSFHPRTFKVETSKSDQLRKRTVRSISDSEMSRYLPKVQALHGRLEAFRLSLQKATLSTDAQQASEHPPAQSPETTDRPKNRKMQKQPPRSSRA